MKIENDRIIEIIEKLKKKRHNRMSDYTNDKVIMLWVSEIHEVLKNTQNK